LRVRANLYVPIDKAGAGDIVALVGLNQTEPGDTLIADHDDFILQKLEIPSPVITAPF
jgi:elongation factor G